PLAIPDSPTATPTRSCGRCAKRGACRQWWLTANRLSGQSGVEADGGREAVRRTAQRSLLGVPKSKGATMPFRNRIRARVYGGAALVAVGVAIAVVAIVGWAGSSPASGDA